MMCEGSHITDRARDLRITFESEAVMCREVRRRVGGLLDSALRLPQKREVKKTSAIRESN